MTSGYLAGIRFQLTVFRRSPGNLIALLATPFLTLAIGQLLEEVSRSDLNAYAVIGPAIIAMWGMALVASGDIIDVDRGNGTLEAFMAVPASLAAVVTGRVIAVTAASLLSVPESLATAHVVLGITIHIGHPALLAVTILASAVSMACTATAFSALFVLARSARTFQNSLSYPLYLLSGAVIPVALLPGWLHPAARVVFLSWSSDLARACLRDGPVAAAAEQLLTIIGLGLAGYCFALVALQMVLQWARFTGTVGHQ